MKDGYKKWGNYKKINKYSPSGRLSPVYLNLL